MPALPGAIRLALRRGGWSAGRQERNEGMSERLTLPVFPLREVVLFPGVTPSLGAGRPGTVSAGEAALATPERLVFAICQRENVEQVTSEGLYTIGTIARIGQIQRGLAGMQSEEHTP